MSERDDLLIRVGKAKRVLATGRVAGSGIRLAARRLLGRQGPTDGLECDYLLEASAQEAFSDDGRVDIPPVVIERTRPVVITTAWAEGLDFYEFARNASGADRCRVSFTPTSRP